MKIVEDNEPKQHLYKILVIGDYAVGKTSLIKRYCTGTFSPNYKLTIGVDFSVKEVIWDSNTTVSLQLWDIAGHERFGTMTRVYYKYAIAAIIVFDLSRSSTFDAVTKWRDDINSKVVLGNQQPIPVLLIANKCDVKEITKQDEEMLDNFVKDHNFIGWFATSAQSNTNIEESMRFLTEKVLEVAKTNIPPNKPDNVVEVDEHTVLLMRSKLHFSIDTSKHYDSSTSRVYFRPWFKKLALDFYYLFILFEFIYHDHESRPMLLSKSHYLRYETDIRPILTPKSHYNSGSLTTFGSNLPYDLVDIYQITECLRVEIEENTNTNFSRFQAKSKYPPDFGLLHLSLQIYFTNIKKLTIIGGVDVPILGQIQVLVAQHCLTHIKFKNVVSVTSNLIKFTFDEEEESTKFYLEAIQYLPSTTKVKLNLRKVLKEAQFQQYLKAWEHLSITSFKFISSNNSHPYIVSGSSYFIPRPLDNHFFLFLESHPEIKSLRIQFSYCLFYMNEHFRILAGLSSMTKLTININDLSHINQDTQPYPITVPPIPQQVKSLTLECYSIIRRNRNILESYLLSLFNSNLQELKLQINVKLKPKFYPILVELVSSLKRLVRFHLTFSCLGQKSSNIDLLPLAKALCSNQLLKSISISNFPKSKAKQYITLIDALLSTDFIDTITIFHNNQFKYIPNTIFESHQSKYSFIYSHFEKPSIDGLMRSRYKTDILKK
eukprot:gene4821-6009_t